MNTLGSRTLVRVCQHPLHMVLGEGPSQKYVAQSVERLSSPLGNDEQRYQVLESFPTKQAPFYVKSCGKTYILQGKNFKHLTNNQPRFNSNPNIENETPEHLALRRLNGQRITHQIHLKTLNMIFFVIIYNL